MHDDINNRCDSIIAVIGYIINPKINSIIPRFQQIRCALNALFRGIRTHQTQDVVF